MIINADKIKYLGRFDFSKKDEVDFSFPASSIKINFEGTKISATLKSTGRDYYTVICDGVIINESFRVIKKKEYVLAENLENKPHILELYKRTESIMGLTTFYGFNIFDGKLLEKPLDDERKIEIIGDSISCGYGNEADNEYISFNPQNENCYLSYGAISARELNASLHITAWAGLGVSRNFDDSPLTMVDRLDFITSKGSNPKWDFNNFIPQIVVINLGTNDFYNRRPDNKLFIQRYSELIDKILNNYNDVKILCSIGPMLKGSELENIKKYIKEAINSFSYDEDIKNRIFFLEFNEQKEENGYGEGYHPNLITHKLMSKQLTEKIKEIINW